MTRSAACLLATLLTLATATAARADQPPARPGPAAAQPPLITTSHLLAPLRVDDFVLENTMYDESRKYAGAGFRYDLPGYGAVRFDVFVYPAGRLPADEALARGMPDFKRDLELAQQSGFVKDLVILSEDAFPLQRPEPETAAAAAPEGKPDDAIGATLAMIAHAYKPIGRRLRMRDVLVDERGDFPIHSNGYLFYRQLYFYKVRVSAGRALISEDEFETLADRAARTLVPAIEVINLGACANRDIEVSPDANPDDFAATLMRRMAQFDSENCYRDAQAAKLDEKSAGASVVTIHFDASDREDE